jgi:hypothetical protein
MLGTWIEPVMAQLTITGFGMVFPYQSFPRGAAKADFSRSVVANTVD